MTDSPNLDIVTKIYDLDPDTAFYFGAEALRRWDGTTATPEEIAAFRAAQLPEFEAVLELRRLAVEQSRYELDRKIRISDLCDKYRSDSDPDNVAIAIIEARMSPQDRAEWTRLWADLGNVMVVLHGDGPQ